MRLVRFAFGALMGATLSWSAALAWAEPVQADPAQGQPAAARSAAAAVADEAGGSRGAVIAALGQPVSSDRLGDLRGGAETVSNMQLNGTVENNSASRVLTGSNTITEGSFSNASGLPTVIQNTGANVLIQNATIVNVQFKP